MLVCLYVSEVDGLKRNEGRKSANGTVAQLVERLFRI